MTQWKFQHLVILEYICMSPRISSILLPCIVCGTLFSEYCSICRLVQDANDTNSFERSHSSVGNRIIHYVFRKQLRQGLIGIVPPPICYAISEKSSTTLPTQMQGNQSHAYGPFLILKILYKVNLRPFYPPPRVNKLR